MKCICCGQEMIYSGGAHWKCEHCDTGTIVVTKHKEEIYIKQKPYVDDEGIWEPIQEYVPEGCTSNYRLVVSREMFIEAYNKWIKDTV